MRRCLPLAALLLTACGRADANDLLDELRDDDYRSFARAPGWERPRTASSAPHGNYVDIYVDDVIADALDEGEPLDAWPEGATIVKDGWAAPAGDELAIIAVMRKRDDGWFFAEYSGSGRVKFAGHDVRVCTNCHAGGDDGVLAFGLP